MSREKPVRNRPITFWRQSRWVVALMLLAFLPTACDDIDEDRRAARAAQGEGPIRVALVWGGAERGLFQEGANLALERVNKDKGILGRPIELVPFSDALEDEEGSALGVAIGRTIAKDPDIVAIIGHSDTATALSASITYEQNGILFLNPAVTDRSLNEHGFQYIFSTIPDNELIGTQIATQAFSRGYRRIGILNSRSDEAFETTEAFAKQAAALGMVIVSRQSFFDQRENFRDIIAGFGYSGFDALFLAAGPANTRAIIRQGMEMNFRMPFLLATLADPLALKRDLGDETSLVIMPILFNPYVKQWQTRRFLRDFKGQYGKAPDGWSAQGYDAVMMLTEAMEKAGSTVPLSVATIIRYTLSWQGITGRHSFDQAGSIYAKTLDFATLNEGMVQFHSAEGGTHTYEAEPMDNTEPEKKGEKVASP